MTRSASALRISRTSQRLGIRSPLLLPLLSHVLGYRSVVSEPTAHSMVRLCRPITELRLGTMSTPSPWDSRPVGDPMFRTGGTCQAQRRCPMHALKCAHCASSIVQGVPRANLHPMAHDGVGVQTCYRRVWCSTTGHWGSGNPALTVSRRRCRTMPYTSSDISRFPTMLLSPRPFGSR